MADYNSPYTGQQVDDAIAKTEHIFEYKEVWAGTPTDQGVSVGSLPVNPGTNDRTGLYFITYGATTDPLVGKHTSRVYIDNEASDAYGDLSGSLSATNQLITKAIYNQPAGEFQAFVQTHNFGDDTATFGSMYIHKVFRLQNIG